MIYVARLMSLLSRCERATATPGATIAPSFWPAAHFSFWGFTRHRPCTAQRVPRPSSVASLVAPSHGGHAMAVLRAPTSAVALPRPEYTGHAALSIGCLSALRLHVSRFVGPCGSCWTCECGGGVNDANTRSPTTCCDRPHFSPRRCNLTPRGVTS